MSNVMNLLKHKVEPVDSERPNIELHNDDICSSKKLKMKFIRPDRLQNAEIKQE